MIRFISESTSINFLNPPEPVSTFLNHPPTMKKKLYTILLVTFSAISLAGQQMPWFSAYSFQPKLLNPAAQGGPSGGGASVAYRSQFSDLPAESRPVTYLLHVDVSPFISERIGLGVLAMQDEAHLAKRTNVTGFFSYHLFPKENDFHLSLGVMAGILNQSMDLSTATVNNPFDLALMQANESKMQFDGGFGLQARIAGLQLDVTLPQLFTSDLEYTPDDAARNIRYDIFPHLLTSLRYRWQGEGFAIEPNVVYREIFGKKLKSANFDFGLRGYFLDNDMLMVGGSYRMDEGGLQFSAGVKPISRMLIFGAYETHSSLGSTFEAGLQYTFGGERVEPTDKIATPTVAPAPNPAPPSAPVPAPPAQKVMSEKEAKNKLSQYKTTAETGQQKVTEKVRIAREKIELARYSLNEAKNTNDRQVQQSRLANADKYFPEIEGLLAEIGIESKKVQEAKTDAEALAEQVKKVRKSKDLVAIRSAYDKVQQENDLNNKFKEIKDLRTAIKPLLDVNDPTSIQNYLTVALASLTSKPDEAKILQVTSTSIEIQYADADEAYKVTAGTGKVKSLADWLGTRIAELKNEGLQFESARLVAELLYSNVDTRVDAKYAADYGQTFKTPYKLNGKDKNSNIKKDATLTLETLAVLKLYDLKRYSVGKIGVPDDKVTLELTAPNSKNEYQQVTRMILNYRK